MMIGTGQGSDSINNREGTELFDDFDGIIDEVTRTPYSYSS